MSFRKVSKSVTLNDLERRNGRYFALFHRTRVQWRRKTITSVSKSTFNSLCPYENDLRNYSAIIWEEQTLITRFDGRRCIDDQVITESSDDSLTELSDSYTLIV